MSSPIPNAAADRSPAIVVLEPERMNLLGLMLASVLERRLSQAAGRRHARVLKGSVLLEASGMRVVLQFTPARIEISKADSGGGADGRDAARTPAFRADAEIRGTLTALLGAALGRDRARSLITGQLKARGAPLTLLRMLSLLRA